MFGQIVRNIAYTGKAESNIYANTQDYIDRSIAGVSIEERLSNIEYFTPPKQQSRNILNFHAYYILYLISPLCYVMSAFDCLTLVQAGSMAMSILFSIMFMREKRIPGFVIFATCLLLMAHPGWSIPAIYGAFYPERMFMGAGLYLVWTLEKKKFSKIHFLVASSLCLAIGERGALYSGMFILSYTIFYWKVRLSHRMLRLITGTVSLVYMAVMMGFVLNNVYYSNIGARIDLLQYFSVQDNVDKVMLFVIINFFCFCIIGLFEPRMLVIAIASMIPNLVYNLGGAEKIGWVLHYHIYYFVFAMWAVVKGVIGLYGWLEKTGRRFSLVWGAGVVLGFAFLVSGISPSDPGISWGLQNVKNHFLYNAPASVWRARQGGKDLRMQFDSFVNSHLQPGDVVSTTESGMVALDGHPMFLFPMGTDLADAVLLSYVEKDGEMYYYGSIVYDSDPIRRERFDIEVMEKLRKEGYLLDYPALFPAYGVAILSKG